MPTTGLSIASVSTRVDELLGNIVRAYEAKFRGRVSYYLIGSYADGSAVPLSDLDLILVFKNQFRDAQEEKDANQLGQKLTASSPIRLDITCRGQDTVESMYAVIRVGLKQASQLVYGADLRDEMPLPSHAAYIEDVIRGALFFISRLHDVERIATLPLDYPDADDRFFGYTRKRFAEWYPPDVSAGTKEFVATVSRIATATAAVKTGSYIGSKQQGIRLFADASGEPWGSFANEVFRRCKLDWQYLIPPSPQERDELTTLCSRMLEFENIFCREIARAEIESANG